MPKENTSSMGSTLGPCFAEFYMSHLENGVFENDPSLRPPIYVRYVDDCFLVLENRKLIVPILQKFEQNSVLKFTVEFEKYQQLAFLDCLIKKLDSSFKTSVFIKDTNAGDCLNFKSICPDRYKTGVVKTLLHRAHVVSSD